jgi:ATP-dependent helicase Lhr and Lhr-like helicase
MSFYTLEYLHDGETPPDLKQIPWNLLQTIAIIQLYLEERWIEPPDIPLMPLSLLYQQTLSAVQARTELTPAQLAQAILTLSPFQAITADEYRLFLRHLVASDQLAQMDEGTLIVGMKGARRTNHYSFYAIFADQQDCQVFSGTQEIGTIHGLPEVESVVGLAGYAWRVISVDERRRMIHVERAKGMVKANWMNFGFSSFHEHVMQRLRQVLQEDTLYTYLSPLAQQRLTLARELARNSDWLRSCVARLEPGRFVLFHWTSSRIYRTLAHLLKHCGWYIELPRNEKYIEIVYDGDVGAVINELRRLSSQVAELVPELVVGLKDSQLWQGKYDALAPRSLLEEAYIHDILDIPGTIRWLANCS